MVVENRAANRRVDVFPIELNGIGVVDVLIVVGMREVNDLAGEAQTNRGQRFDLAHFERDQHIVNVGEGTAFTLGARLAFCQVVETQAPCPAWAQ